MYVPTSGWEVLGMFSYQQCFYDAGIVPPAGHQTGNYRFVIHWFFTRNLHFIENMVVHNWSFFLCCTCKNLYFCLCCLLMSGSSNWTHIIDGIDDMLFSCFIYFIQQWAAFNIPPSKDIFAIMLYHLFIVTCNRCGKLPLVSAHLWCKFLSIVVLCLMYLL